MAGSQLRAAYEGSAVQCNAGALRRMLEPALDMNDFHQSSDATIYTGNTNYNLMGRHVDGYESDVLQPMVVTPSDVARLMEELRNERLQKENEYRGGEKDNNTKENSLFTIEWFKCLYKMLLPKRGDSKTGFRK